MIPVPEYSGRLVKQQCTHGITCSYLPWHTAFRLIIFHDLVPCKGKITVHPVPEVTSPVIEGGHKFHPPVVDDPEVLVWQ